MPREAATAIHRASKPKETVMTRMKLRKLGLGALIALPVFTVLEATRANGWDFPAQGTWTDCNIVTSIRQTGPLLRIVVDISQTFTGTLDGGYVGTEDVTVLPDGTATFTGEGTFTGAIDGRTGRAVYRYEGTVNAEGVGAATWTLYKGTDDLERLQGNGTFAGTGIALQVTRFTPFDPTVCDGGMYGGDYEGTLKYTND
jgi:hypothetical protein